MTKNWLNIDQKLTGSELTWVSRYFKPVLSNIFLLERASTTDISSDEVNLANFNARSTLHVFSKNSPGQTDRPSQASQKSLDLNQGYDITFTKYFGIIIAQFIMTTINYRQ